MKNFLREYLTFNQREKRGLIILMSIIVALVIIKICIPYIVKPSITNDYSAFEKEIDSALASNEIIDAEDSVIDEFELSNSELATQNPITLHPEPAEGLFPFNPNKLPKDKWKQLGLSDKQINTIHNYENKGGKFYKKEDLKKIYGISEKDYKRLEPYIDFPNQKPITLSLPKGETLNSKPKNLLIDLNSADSSQLITLKGIGPSFASRIIKYRNLLGGFHHQQQLLEVYGFTNEMLTNIENQIKVDNEKTIKLNINTSDINQLKKHPYIKYNNAKLIVNYRNANGNYKHIEEIKKIHLMNDSMFSKISPYIFAQ